MKLSKVTTERINDRSTERTAKLICENPLNHNMDHTDDGFELVLNAGEDQPFYELRLTVDETKTLRDLLSRADI